MATVQERVIAATAKVLRLDPADVKPEHESMGLYCRRAFGAVSVSFEFPWFGRKRDDVRKTGAQALKALLMAIDEAGVISR
jgi:hypothetical protein